MPMHDLLPLLYRIAWAVPLALYFGGLGLLSMNPPDFSLSRWAVSVSCSWIGAVCLIWEFQTEQDLWTRWVIGAAIGVIVFCVWPTTVQYIGHREEDFLLRKIPAELIPGSKPLPARRCPTGISVVIGSNVHSAATFPFEAIRVSGRPLITLNMTANGGLTATFDVRDRDFDLIARVEKNVVDPYSRGHMLPRADLHSLIINNQRGEKALGIEFSNPQTIVITGKFFIAPKIYLLMEESGMSRIDASGPQERILEHMSDSVLCTSGNVSMEIE
jgi:hypothetical protein